MKSYQLAELMQKYGQKSTYGTHTYTPSHQSRLVESQTDLPKLIITAGRYKGKIGTLDGFTPRMLELVLEENQTRVTAKYQSIEFIGSDGSANIAPVTDMTGREIIVGSWLTYSQNYGNSHALSLGQVTRMTPAGGMKIKTVLTDGKRVKSESEKLLSYPERTLLLPCEPEKMTIWLLKDFEDIAETGFDPDV